MTESKALWERQKDRVIAAMDTEELELTEWENKFLLSLDRQLSANKKELSVKQLAVLENVELYIRCGRPTR